jgi:hypothetical protein
MINSLQLICRDNLHPNHNNIPSLFKVDILTIMQGTTAILPFLLTDAAISCPGPPPARQGALDHPPYSLAEPSPARPQPIPPTPGDGGWSLWCNLSLRAVVKQSRCSESVLHQSSRKYNQLSNLSEIAAVAPFGRLPRNDRTFHAGVGRHLAQPAGRTSVQIPK